MIASNVQNQRIPEASFAKAHYVLPDPLVEETITEIKSYKTDYTTNTYLYSITLSNMTHAWYAGMKVKVSETNVLDGEWYIQNVDDANKTIIVECSYETQKTATTGKAIMTGVVNHSVVPGTPLYNDDKKIIAIVYDSSQSFLIDVNKDLQDNKEMLIQIVNIGANQISTKVLWSLDAVHWLNFVVPIQFNVNANKSDGIFVTQIIRNMKIKIEVTTTGNDNKYYILYS